MILVESEVSEEWDSSNWPELAERAVKAALTVSQADFAGRDAEVAVRFTSDEELRALNAAWRGKDKPTNVLSFPMLDASDIAGLPPGAELLLGDIVLAHGVCRREAEEKGIGMRDHATHLIVHGTLHLIGHDHHEDEAAEEMEAIERRTLASLGIADPYPLSEVAD